MAGLSLAPITVSAHPPNSLAPSPPAPAANAVADDARAAASPGSADPSAGEDPLSPPAGHSPADRDPSPLTVTLDLQTADLTPPVSGWLEIHLAAIGATAGVRDGQLNLIAVDDAAMTQLHEQYKQAAHTTDVLTFDLRDSVEPGQESVAPMEADIVVCLDEAVRQAEQRGHAARLEVLLYAVHGLLHLLGEDDAHAHAAQRMHEREDRLLREAGLGPVFARPRIEASPEDKVM